MNKDTYANHDHTLRHKEAGDTGEGQSLLWCSPAMGLEGEEATRMTVLPRGGGNGGGQRQSATGTAVEGEAGPVQCDMQWGAAVCKGGPQGCSTAQRQQSGP